MIGLGTIYPGCGGPCGARWGKGGCKACGRWFRHRCRGLHLPEPQRRSLGLGGRVLAGMLTANRPATRILSQTAKAPTSASQPHTLTRTHASSYTGATLPRTPLEQSTPTPACTTGRMHGPGLRMGISTVIQVRSVLVASACCGCVWRNQRV